MLTLQTLKYQCFISTDKIKQGGLFNVILLCWGLSESCMREHLFKCLLFEG